MAENEKDKDEAKKTAKQLADEREKLEILARAGHVKGEQLFVGTTGDVERENELRQFALGTIEDPDKKFDVYYKGIGRLLLAHLPKGKTKPHVTTFTKKKTPI